MASQSPVVKIDQRSGRNSAQAVHKVLSKGASDVSDKDSNQRKKSQVKPATKRIERANKENVIVSPMPANTTKNTPKVAVP